MRNESFIVMSSFFLTNKDQVSGYILYTYLVLDYLIPTCENIVSIIMSRYYRLGRYR